MKLGDRVQGTMQGQAYTGTVKNIHYVGGHVSLDGTHTDCTINAVHVRTDVPLRTPAGRQVHTALLRGAQEVASLQALHNCTNPPHFPPHCGCPAG